MDVVVNPPQPGSESYPLYKEQREKVLADLKYKAKLVAETFNAIEGVSCQAVQVNLKNNAYAHGFNTLFSGCNVRISKY